MHRWWATRRKFTIKSSSRSGNLAEIPDMNHMNICGNFVSSIATLNIKAATVPRAMIVTLLATLGLSLRAMWLRPLRRQIPLCDRQRSGQPQHCATAGQHPRNLLSCLRQHGRFDTTVPASAL